MSGETSYNLKTPLHEQYTVYIQVEGKLWQLYDFVEIFRHFPSIVHHIFVVEHQI